ncbi:MAG: thiamine-phosphate kinase [Myxococcota bacterium]
MPLPTEFELIDRIERQAKSAGVLADCLVTIGDDAAAYIPKNEAVILSTDAAIEKVHFDYSIMPASAVGFRSLAANVSDLSAMGSTPVGFLLSLVLNPKMPLKRLTATLAGMFDCAKKSACPLMGGNISRTNGPLTIAITIIGEAKKNKLALRKGAKPGDIIAVTGSVGDSYAGLMISLGRIRYTRQGALALRRAYGFPPIRLSEGQLLAQSGVSSMIDISDGLLQDLGHILKASGVGADLYADKIPLSKNLRNCAANLGEPPYRFALSGGEDYELLFTIPPEQFTILKRNYPIGFAPIAEIGVIRKSQGLSLYFRGEELHVEPSGWKHF